MSALALILANRGYSVSGSDQEGKSNLKRLANQGVKIFSKQVGANIHSIYKSSTVKPLIVVSTAIPNSNPEIQEAKKAKLEICHRSDLLATLISEQDSIAVAGSHGKTTTSTIITTLLALANEDPTAIIGGLVPYYKSNGHAGKGRLLVAEADESDGSLVKFRSSVGIITNLELDHSDHYKSLDELIRTMKEFGNNCEFLLANHDCPTLRKNFKPHAWFSIENKEGIDFSALPIAIKGDQTIANFYEKGKAIGQIAIPMPGLHNLHNTIAAIAACRVQGIPFKELQANLEFIKSPGRRFEFLGTWEGRQVVDDYAHHPSELKATLQTARLIIQKGESPLPKKPKRLVAIFQPHRYSRTKQFLSDFAYALSKADLVFLAPVYGAGEEKVQLANSEDLEAKIKQIDSLLPIFVAKNHHHLALLIKEKSVKDDLLLIMGAGDINKLWKLLNNADHPPQCLPSRKAA